MFNRKGFTLIELIMVTIILGILAAVGVVAYNGYTASAKANAAKTMHSQAVKYISAEIQKCSLGESKFMGTNQDCPATAAKAVSGAVNTMTDKNPYNTANKAAVSGASTDQGVLSVTSTAATPASGTTPASPAKITISMVPATGDTPLSTDLTLD